MRQIPRVGFKMKPNTVITSAYTHTDIDTLACGVALNDIQNKTNLTTSLFLPGPLNQSVTPSIRKWKYSTSTAEISNESDLIMVDVSDPDYLKPHFNLSKIIEVYDHHFGFEEYWLEKIGDKAHIESVGACATLIWEKAIENKVVINEISANLLYTAIISNTLNFNSTVTHDRDRKAFTEISRYINLPNNWTDQYFQELESESIRDPENSIIHDIKVVSLPNLDAQLFIGQLELWHSQDFLQKNLEIIKKSLEAKQSPYWFFTSPSISEGKNYLYSENNKIKTLLTNILNVDFVGNIGTTSKLILRKEILKKLQNVSKLNT